jgi:hypothetical protein
MEEWRKIPGFADHYECSSLGKFRRLAFKTNKRPFSFPAIDIVGTWLDYKGYKKIRIKGKVCSTHRLIAKAFLPNPENLPQVNHRNGIKDDNRAENLEWCDNSGNQQHAIRTGLKRVGSASPSATKLTEWDVTNILLYASRWPRPKKIYKKFGISRGFMGQVLRRKKWKRLNGVSGQSTQELGAPSDPLDDFAL